MYDLASSAVTLADALAEGLADAEAGRLVPVSEAFARVRAALKIADETDL